MTTTNTYNAAGALLRSRTQTDPLSLVPQPQMRQYYDEAFSYSRGGLIKEKYYTQDGESRRETYGYDKAARLTSSFERAWPGSPMFGVASDQTVYEYDAAGNRTRAFRETRVNNVYLPTQQQQYSHTPGTNQLERVSDATIINGAVAGRATFDDQLTYDPDGSMISRTKNRAEDGMRQQKIETFGYDAFNLIHVYTVQTATTTGAEASCAPDASLAPVEQWRYRFGPLQEREQKRQLFSSADTTLAWVYTLVGADGKQLATYNGLQGALCGRDGVRLWPVEFNTYGPNNTRIITRADGTSEVVISDYLGSARVTLSSSGEPLQSSSYHPFGTERTSTGSGARTSYIGREHDNESDLGFYGVRLYEPEYGRFLSTDVLWSKYLPLQPYQYAGNSPVMAVDYDGREVSFASLLSTASFDDDTRAQEIVDRTVEDLRWLTGLSSLSVGGDGVLTFDANETAQGGSIAARTLVTGLIASPEILDVVSSGVNEADPAKNTVGLNYDQTASFIAGTSSNLDNRTMGFGTTFLHEALHTPMGGGLDDGGAGTPGPVENTVNVIRSQMCEPLGQRLLYGAIRVHGVPTIPFSAASLTTIQEGKQPVSSYVRLPSEEDK
ncbi:MAG: hypothetical protein FGM32_04325 [Candidatus Kapabacteria bacterium]|nr:hypothetical protein [Candidatus Kapabacteria bacterium]